jgi:hypothetical protein
MPASSAYDDPTEGNRHGGLGDDRPERGATDAEAEAVHEHDVERDVADGTGNGDDERSPRVL